MSLENIIAHIQSESDKEKQAILDQAKKDEQSIIEEAWAQRDELYKDLFKKEEESILAEKKRVIVNESIEGKKRILKRKQELIDALFQQVENSLKKSDLKKKQVFNDKEIDAQEDVTDFLKRIRFELEPEIVKILFS